MTEFETITESMFVEIYEGMADPQQFDSTSVKMHHGEHPELGEIMLINGTAGDYGLIKLAA